MEEFRVAARSSVMEQQLWEVEKFSGAPLVSGHMIRPVPLGVGAQAGGRGVGGCSGGGGMCSRLEKVCSAARGPPCRQLR